jgi:nucleoid-associated protein YgaU
VIRTIFEANRAVLSDPDMLPVDVELVLPPIAGTTRSTASGDGSAAARGTPSAARSVADRTNTRTGTFRWYQIRKNDRYISIAREQLGDANRWQEIYELNKDKFPDPQRIREGVRIKLPSASTALARRQQG